MKKIEYWEANDGSRHEYAYNAKRADAKYELAQLIVEQLPNAHHNVTQNFIIQNASLLITLLKDIA